MAIPIPTTDLTIDRIIGLIIIDPIIGRITLIMPLPIILPFMELGIIPTITLDMDIYTVRRDSVFRLEEVTKA